MQEFQQKKVKLVAAFLGVKFLPMPFSIGSNNLNPKLILKESHIEYRNIFFTNKKPYTQIDYVDIYTNSLKIFGITTTNICIFFKNDIFTFVGNLNSAERLKDLLITFSELGVILSEKSIKFIENS